jgi:UDP-glucose 4-epimerase
MMRHTEKIVVTGGAGFIGSHLVDRLLADSHAEIVVLDDLSSGLRANLAQHGTERRLQLIEGDIRDPAAATAALRGATVVYHLAARAPDGDTLDDVHEVFATNVVGTFNVLRAAVAHGVGHVIFTSSYAVYGEPIALPVEESHPLLAVDCHGASKVAAEAYCRAFRRVYGLHTVVLRLAHVYGPRDRDPVIPTWVSQAAGGQDLCVYGGKQVLDFLWVGDAVEALVRAGQPDGPLPAINVASGTGTRITDVARLIRRLAGGQGQIKLLPARPIEITRFVGSVERMREVLKLEPLAHLASLLPAAPVGAR